MCADAVVSGVQGDGTDVTYHLELDPRWQVLRLSVTEGDREVDLTRDSRAGTWRDAGGAVLPELQGCADVDISVTPFTNTLPIRRLQLAEGESAEIRVAYVHVPGLGSVPSGSGTRTWAAGGTGTRRWTAGTQPSSPSTSRGSCWSTRAGSARLP